MYGANAIYLTGKLKTINKQMKLTKEEQEKIMMEWMKSEVCEIDFWNEDENSDTKIGQFWLSKIDTILEERIKETIGKHNARILNHFQLFGEDERVALIPAITKATEETLPSLK